MSDEVWWLARGSGDVGVGLFVGDKPRIVIDLYNDEKTITLPGDGGKRIALFTTTECPVKISDDEIIPIRPLRIERVEVENG